MGSLLIPGIQCEAVYSQREITVRIEPGAVECFYERAQKNQIIDFEYQVIDGGHGDLDISFELQNPNGHSIITEYKKSDNIHRFDAIIDGDYRYCFDNSFSTFNAKTVFFELIIEWDGEQGGASGKQDEWGRDILDNAIPEKLLKERVCLHTLSANSSNLTKIILICYFCSCFRLFASGSRDSRVSPKTTCQFEYNAKVTGYPTFIRST